MKLTGLLGALLIPAVATAAPIASSSFAGVENPLLENGAWAALTSLSPNGGRFQKNNAAFPNRFSPDHAGARTTAALPAGVTPSVDVRYPKSSTTMATVLTNQ